MYKSLGGPAAIQAHTEAIRAWLYQQLSALRHSNGAPLLRLAGRHAAPNASEVQGSTFNFQILKPNGEVFSYRHASTALADAGFHMRCGCTCSPGACYGFLGVKDEEVAAAARLAHGHFRRAAAVLRVVLGGVICMAQGCACRATCMARGSAGGGEASAPAAGIHAQLLTQHMPAHLPPPTACPPPLAATGSGCGCAAGWTRPTRPPPLRSATARWTAGTAAGVAAGGW